MEFVIHTGETDSKQIIRQGLIKANKEKGRKERREKGRKERRKEKKEGRGEGMKGGECQCAYGCTRLCCTRRWRGRV